jgi:O-antigen ligase
MTLYSLVAVCLALAWSVPFVYPYAGEPLSSFYNDALAIGFGLAACAFLLIRRGPLLFPRALLLPFGLATLIGVQMLLGWLPYPQWGLLAANYLLWACVMMMAGARLVNEWGSERTAFLLAWALIAGGLINALVSIAQSVGYFLPFWLALPNFGHSVFGNLAQTNHLANYTSLAIASTVFLYSLRRLALPLFCILSTPLVLTLAATGSRSAWLHMGALLTLAWWMRRDIAPLDRPRLTIACAALLPALATGAGLLALLRDNLPGAAVTALTRASAQTFAADPRLDLWRETLQVFLAHPWLGVGQGNFAWHHFLLNGTAGHPSYPDPFENAHNFVLQIGAEFGVAGLCLIGAAICLWLGRRAPAPATLARWWWSAILAVIAVHSVLEYPLWYGHFLGIAAVAVGALDATPWRINATVVRARVWAGVVVVVGVFILASHVLDYRRLEAFLRERVRVTADGQTRLAIEQLLRVRSHSLLAPLVDFGLARGIRYEPALLQANLELNGRVMRLFPVWDVTYRQAILLAMNGQTDSAAATWIQATRGFPHQRGTFTAQLKQLAAAGLPGAVALDQAVRELMDKE